MNAFFFQELVELSLQADRLPMPGFFREAVKSADFDNIEKLEDFFKQEVQNTSLQDSDSSQYFLFVSRLALLHAFYRHDAEQFTQTVEIFRHRMVALRNLNSKAFPVEAWEQYLSILDTSVQRICRHVSIEVFEGAIGDLDWSLFNKDFIVDISTVLGYVYLNDEAGQKAKSRIWFQKALHERSDVAGLMNRLLMISYFQREGGTDASSRVVRMVEELKEIKAEISHQTVAQIYEHAIFELEAANLKLKFENFDDPLTRLENSQLRLKELETRFAREEGLPNYSRAAIHGIIADLYGRLYTMTDDSLEQATFSKHATQAVDNAIEVSESIRNFGSAQQYRLQRARLGVDTGYSLTEKELKELIQHYKKQAGYPQYIEAIHAFVDLLVRNGHAHKSYDIVLDIFKLGNKKMAQGGFYLVNAAMKIANHVMLAETTKPGVSWMVEILDGYFEKVAQVINELDDQLEEVGPALIEDFRQAFITFEPVSHFNIKLYYIYQYYSIKVARLGSLLAGDTTTVQVLDKLISELDDENNPLNFVKAEWTEFKSVPNSVRNKTLNKCINISKGDLPLAAEHLDFSYRNLRSYITFKEVNRLGFFLDMQQTNNRQLEQGIRYMFYDLYRNGTIFEVVFDMPKFLVEYSKTGFYSQDLEQELNIKGTTAKKYIKIMIEIGLIRQDKATGRKHYYRLVRENVMNRLGKDQTTLIS